MICNTNLIRCKSREINKDGKGPESTFIRPKPNKQKIEGLVVSSQPLISASWNHLSTEVK